MTEFRSGTHKVRGATLSYDVREGAAPTVIVLHGLGSSRANDVTPKIFDWAPAEQTGAAPKAVLARS